MLQMPIVLYIARGKSRDGFFMSSTELQMTANPVNAKNVSARLPMMGGANGQVSTDCVAASGTDVSLQAESPATSPQDRVILRNSVGLRQPMRRNIRAKCDGSLKPTVPATSSIRISASNRSSLAISKRTSSSNFE